jgi:hypothetical protein
MALEGQEAVAEGGATDFALDRAQVLQLLGYVVGHLLPADHVFPADYLLGALDNAVPQILGLREEPCGCIDGMACSDWDCPGAQRPWRRMSPWLHP